VKIGSRANTGDMVVKVEVAVQGDAKKFDVIGDVNNGIRYLYGLKSIESLKSSGGTDAGSVSLASIKGKPL